MIKIEHGIRICLLSILICLILYQFSYSQRIYFGDLHVHSGLSFDNKFNVDTLYVRAKRDFKLDFISVTDHDHGSTELKWEKVKSLVSKYYEPFVFVTILGYEYTKFDQSGHKIVLYPNDNNVRFEMEKYNEKQLFDSVFAHNGIIQIAHPDYGRFPSNVNLYDGRVVRNIEIVGSSGQYNFEYFGNPNAEPEQKQGSSVRDWLKKERLLGFAGVSDSHDGKLGKTAITAVIADSLTRESIFNALNKRHTYAISGAQRMFISFKSGDYIMGDSIPYIPGEIRKIEFSCKGTDTLETVEIIKNGTLFKSFKPNEEHTSNNFPNQIEFELEDEDEYSFAYYYVKVYQRDGNIAFTSPLYFYQVRDTQVEYSSNRISRIKSFSNSPNPFDNETVFNYEINESAAVSIKMYDILGRLLNTLNGGNKLPGSYFLRFNGTQNIAKGLIIVELEMKNENGIERKIIKITHF